MVSLLCLGGHAATNPKNLTKAQSLRLIQRAVDEGVTFLDNAWDYNDGVAEERMGKALAEGKLPRQGLPDDQVLRPRRQGGAIEPGGQPQTAPDRPHRPLAVPRNQLRQRPRPGSSSTAARWSRRSRRRSRGRSATSASRATSIPRSISRCSPSPTTGRRSRCRSTSWTASYRSFQHQSCRCSTRAGSPPSA